MRPRGLYYNLGDWRAIWHKGRCGNIALGIVGQYGIDGAARSLREL
jgi:hypothetical protein